MTRRQFLRVTARTSLLALTSLSVPLLATGASQAITARQQALVSLNGVSYRGAERGQIEAALSGGNAWQKCADFGAHCSVLHVAERQGQLFAKIGVQGYSFVLKSTDGRTWYTADYIPPAA